MVEITCKGKGGRYELIGVATGAGTSRGQEIVLYRDMATNDFYFRTEEDFEERMEPVDE